MKQFASFRLDTANERLWLKGEQIALQPKPYAVLRYLVENPGRLITHDELLDALWPETYVQPQILRTYMLELRKVLGDSADEPKFIQTLPKRGYCFLAAVTDAGEDAGSRRDGKQAKTAAGGAAANAGNKATPGSQQSGIAGQASVVGQLSLAASASLVGRDKDFARLAAEIELMQAGQRRIVFISGEAGIGKTALTDALASGLRGQNGAPAPVLYARGQCVPGIGGREQFYPVLEALGQLCASADGEAACRVLARMAPECLALLGRQDREPANFQARGGADGRMPGNLCAAVEELAALKPLVLIFEDLQWADECTLQLISALARRRANARLMVVATYRARSAAQDLTLKQLRQDLLMQRLATEIVLEPLFKAAIGALLAVELGAEAPPALGNFIERHAEGNPLFAISILKHLMAQRLLFRGPGNRENAWELATGFEREAGVPQELAQMVELEIARLPEQDQRILEAGSLMNVAFPAWSVAAALSTGPMDADAMEADAMEIEEACEKLARSAHFLERIGLDELPDGTRCAFYAFTHGIYREVLYQRQSEARRARRHRRIAERLGQLFAGREAHVAREMAMHYEAAGDRERGAETLRVAAEYAGQRNAHAEAAELMERAEALKAGNCRV